MRSQPLTVPKRVSVANRLYVLQASSTILWFAYFQSSLCPLNQDIRLATLLMSLHLDLCPGFDQHI